MKKLVLASVLALSFGSAAHAQEAAPSAGMECCEKMKAEGKECCCCDDMAQHGDDDHAGHEGHDGHQGHGTETTDAPQGHQH